MFGQYQKSCIIFLIRFHTSFKYFKTIQFCRPQIADGGSIGDFLLGNQFSYSSIVSQFLCFNIRKIFLLSLIHISEPTRRTPISYAVFCLKKKKKKNI